MVFSLVLPTVRKLLTGCERIFMPSVYPLAARLPLVFRYTAVGFRYLDNVAVKFNRITDGTMKKFKVNGGRVKGLRENRERRATQKEFAHEVGISIRQLRLIENENIDIPADVLDRIAKALSAPRQAVVFAFDQPCLVHGNGSETLGVQNVAGEAEKVTVPRFDTDYITVVRDETEIFGYAKNSQVIVAHMLTGLNAETESYAEECLTSAPLGHIEVFS
jgi:transcriptional regulator with XRE-family HTH domain